MSYPGADISWPPQARLYEPEVEGEAPYINPTIRFDLDKLRNPNVPKLPQAQF